MKRIIAMLLLLALAVSLAACGPQEVDPATAIVGKWKNAAGAEMEFLADGTGTCALGDSGTRPCTWKYDAENDWFVVNYSTSDHNATVEQTNEGLVLTWQGEAYKRIG